jgi:hypothetical protein
VKKRVGASGFEFFVKRGPFIVSAEGSLHDVLFKPLVQFHGRMPVQVSRIIPHEAADETVLDFEHPGLDCREFPALLGDDPVGEQPDAEVQYDQTHGQIGQFDRLFFRANGKREKHG